MTHRTDHHPHDHPERWILGGFLGVLAILALFLAAYAQGGNFYNHGLALFGLCTLLIFRLIGRSFDEIER